MLLSISPSVPLPNTTSTSLGEDLRIFRSTPLFKQYRLKGRAVAAPGRGGVGGRDTLSGREEVPSVPMRVTVLEWRPHVGRH